MRIIHSHPWFQEIKVDDRHYKWLLGLGPWRISVNGYVVSGSGDQERMHRLIFEREHGYLPKEIDHKNRDKLDNRVTNLRKATTSQNATNVKHKLKGTSKYRGVFWSQVGLRKSRKMVCVTILVILILKSKLPRLTIHEPANYMENLPRSTFRREHENHQ